MLVERNFCLQAELAGLRRRRCLWRGTIVHESGGWPGSSCRPPVMTGGPGGAGMVSHPGERQAGTHQEGRFHPPLPSPTPLRASDEKQRCPGCMTHFLPGTHLLHGEGCWLLPALRALGLEAGAAGGHPESLTSSRLDFMWIHGVRPSLGCLHQKIVVKQG